MCYTDVWATQGYGGDIYPQTPGHEVVGEIVEVGAGVHTRRVGDRVGTTWVQSACGRCPYCRENRPLSGQTAMNCDAPRTTGFASQGGTRNTLPWLPKGRCCCRMVWRILMLLR
ncbi:alcohol dehydrogenase catalytic domain-containing protein [Pandoraea sputorum]|uniref:alcohol dehydrogenase catalytic domain-containing protein n=1 Tax=Pandoraea sputorum TaxID=93222 RepID=UPI003969C483